MSRVIDRAPLAVTTDGDVFINLATFDVRKRVETLIEAAVQQRGAIFIRVRADRGEVALVLERLFDSTYEAASLCVGARRKKRKKK